MNRPLSKMASIFLSLLFLSNISAAPADIEVPVNTNLDMTGMGDVSTLVSDGGWSSSGGGEFIYDRHNPWFMGSEPVKWCINHGGNTNFSLSEADVKKSVEFILSEYSTQIKRAQDLNVNSNDTMDISTCPVRFLINDVSPSGQVINTFCKELFEFSLETPFLPAPAADLGLIPYTKNVLKITDDFIFEKDCSKAELEFVFGNVQDPKVQALVKRNTEKFFRYTAGVAMRTSYDTSKFRGKGFVYIAADKGNLSYTGPSAGADFWSKTKTKYQHNPNLVFILEHVLAHEIGHIFGLRHSRDYPEDLMDEEFPSHIIASEIPGYNGSPGVDHLGNPVGVIDSKEGLSQRLGIFTGTRFSLFRKPLYIGYAPFEFNQRTQRDVVFVFEFNPRENRSGLPGDRFHTRGAKSPYGFSNRHKLRVVETDFNTGQIKVVETFELDWVETCGSNPVDSINVKYIDPLQGYMQEKALVRFEDKEICGYVVIGDDELKYPFFHLSDRVRGASGLTLKNDQFLKKYLEPSALNQRSPNYRIPLFRHQVYGEEDFGTFVSDPLAPFIAP